MVVLKKEYQKWKIIDKSFNLPNLEIRIKVKISIIKRVTENNTVKISIIEVSQEEIREEKIREEKIREETINMKQGRELMNIRDLVRILEISIRIKKKIDMDHIIKRENIKIGNMITKTR